MKILKTGTLPPPVDIVEVFQGRCWKCKTEVEAERNEVNCVDQFYSCKCPTDGCGVGIWLYRIVTEVPRLNNEGFERKY